MFISLILALLEKKEKEEEMELIPHEIQITADKIKKFTFPIYVPPNVKDDMVRYIFIFSVYLIK